MRRLNHHPRITLSISLRSLELAALVALVPATAPADEDLFVFGNGFNPEKVVVTDAKVSLAGGGGLRVDTGHQQPWPGIILRAPNEHWDLSRYAIVAVTARNLGTNPVTLYCRVDNPGADGTDHCVTGSVKINGGREETVNVSLKRESGDTLRGKLFGMRGYPAAPGGTGTVDPTNLTQLLIFVSKPSTDHSFEVEKVQARGSHAPPTACITDSPEFFPFIDTLGQYRHKTWPGKVKSPEELHKRWDLEREELKKQPSPPEWDKYGGWQGGPHLRMTGFFRTEKHGGKWWLVDPEGRLFFSHGIDCVGSRDGTPIEERETWFENFPGNDAVFGEFLTQGHALKGHYAGRNPRSFSFGGANLLRKYGPNWAAIYVEFIHQRLRSWGINTIANWQF